MLRVSVVETASFLSQITASIANDPKSTLIGIATFLGFVYNAIKKTRNDNASVLSKALAEWKELADGRKEKILDLEKNLVDATAEIEEVKKALETSDTDVEELKRRLATALSLLEIKDNKP